MISVEIKQFEGNSKKTCKEIPEGYFVGLIESVNGQRLYHFHSGITTTLNTPQLFLKTKCGIVLVAHEHCPIWDRIDDFVVYNYKPVKNLSIKAEV